MKLHALIAARTNSGEYREVPLCWYQGCAQNCRYFCELCVARSAPVEAHAPEQDPSHWYHFREEGECESCAGTGLGTAERPVCDRCQGSGIHQQLLGRRNKAA